MSREEYRRVHRMQRFRIVKSDEDAPPVLTIPPIRWPNAEHPTRDEAALAYEAAHRLDTYGAPREVVNEAYAFAKELGLKWRTEENQRRASSLDSTGKDECTQGEGDAQGSRGDR